MSEAKRKAPRVTRLKVSTLEENQKQELEAMFFALEAARTDAVQAQRKAEAQALNARTKLNEFLQRAAACWNEVAVEPFWFVFRKDGDIILESPFTERDQRNLLRAQRNIQLEAGRQAAEESGDEGLYEEGDEEESK